MVQMTKMMKRVCNRPIQIDALTMCYSVVTPYHYEQLCKLDYGECYEMQEFRLYRTDGRYFDNIYIIRLFDGKNDVDFGHVKFNLCHGDKSSNIHTNEKIKVWISINNAVLYSNLLHSLDYIATCLGFEAHNVTSLDLCLDTNFNVSTTLKTLIRDKNVTTILNGKRILDRDADRPEIIYTQTGSLNKFKYLTINIKQKNALHDKTKGTSITTYDKAAEIRNASDKFYILDYYGNPKKLFRTELHLNNEEVKSYLENHGIEFTPLFLFDNVLLEDIFFHYLNSVIRFKCKDKSVCWLNILGRRKVITTPSAGYATKHKFSFINKK